jgi:general secretion pathway protein D
MTIARPRSRLPRLAPRLCAAVLALAACSTLDQDFVRGRELVEAGQVEEGLKLVEKASAANPRNPEYRSYLVTRRVALSQRRTAEAEAALERGDFGAADKAFRAALAADSGNARAASGLARVALEREQRKLLDAAEADLKAQRLANAEATTRRVLNGDPRNERARDLLGRVQAARSAAERPRAEPGGALARPMTLEFRDATLRELFDALARATGVSFVIDKDVRTDARVTFFVRDTRLDELLRMVLATNGLERKLLNATSMLIYPNTPAKQREYQELAVRSFYLGNADPKQALALIRTMLKTRDLFVDEKLNLLVMRDSPEAIRIAEKLIAAQDLPEPEVLLELEVMEVSRGKLQELGVQWPATLTALNIVPTPTTTTTTGGVVVTTANATTTTTQLTLEALRNLGPASIGVSPNPYVVARGESSNANILANPRIRVRNREKARVHIGDRVPVITTTSTANVGVSESVTYLDVGLKLDAEPNVHGNGEVAIKLALEVSNIAKEVKSAGGTLTYQLGTRNAATVLRVKDGETQVLAGLIGDEDRAAASKVPGLGDLPVVGRLFGVSRDTLNRTEIVLLVTPRIVRSLALPVGYEVQFDAGTEAAPGAIQLALAPAARAGLAATARSGAAAPAPAAAQPPATAAAPPESAARVQLQLPESAALGGTLQVGIALADAPPDARGGAELVYDPAALAAEGAAPAGRIALPLGGQLGLRVIALQPGTTQLRLENASFLDAAGRALPVQPHAPAQLRLTAP